MEISWAQKVSAYVKGSSSLQFLLSNATEKLERAMALPGQLINLHDSLRALASASPGPYVVSFCDWEYYQAPEAVLERTLQLLVDANADKVVVLAGMFGMGKSSLARYIACNPYKLQKVRIQVYTSTKCTVHFTSLGCLEDKQVVCLQAQELVSKPCAFNAGVLWVHCGVNCTDDFAIAEKQKELLQTISPKVCANAAIQQSQ